MPTSEKLTNIAPQGHLNDPADSAPLVYPGVRGKLKKAITTKDSELAAGTTVIIQPLNHNQANTAAKFIITPYKKNMANANSELPESQRDIIAGESYNVTLDHPQDILTFNNEHFLRNEEALFPNSDSPSLQEIKQCRIPDCFFLAAIQSIINHPNGKAFIRGMMRQNEDGTTTVRLYDPSTLKPEYVRVENSVIADGFGELSHHTALWVHILEKAYAARGKSDTDIVDASISSVYSDGGKKIIALKSLTGLNTKSYSTKKPTASPLQVEAFLGKENFSALTLIGLPDQAVLNYLNTIEKEKVNAICELFGIDMKDESAKEEALNQYIEIIKYCKSNPKQFNEACESRSVNSIAKENPVVATLLAGIFKRLSPFSGTYTKSQQDVYNAINESLAQGKLVTAGTPKKLPGKTPGIVSNHAYTVLGTVEKELQVKDENGEINTIKTYFIKVRNPWGEKDGLARKARVALVGGVGRAYEQHREDLTVRTIDVNEPTFLVELNDFCHYFSDYDITDSADRLFLRDARMEACKERIDAFTKNLDIQFTSSDAELINANQTYQLLIKDLLEVEFMELTRFDTKTMEDVFEIFAKKYDMKTEKTSIEPLLNHDDNTTSQTTARLYLLKIKWLQSQDPIDKNALEDSLDKVQNHSSHSDLWQKLSDTKFKLNLVLSARENSEDNNLEYMRELANKLMHDFRKFDALIRLSAKANIEIIEAELEILISNYKNLEYRYQQLMKSQLLLKNFGYTTHDDKELKKIDTAIQQCDGLIQSIIEIKPHLKTLIVMCDEIRQEAVDLCKNKNITEEQKKEIVEATKEIFTDKFEKVGKKLSQGKSTAERQLGHKIFEADSIAKKIKHVFSQIGTFFKKASARFALFFHTKNEYEYKLPAMVKNTQPQLKLK